MHFRVVCRGVRGPVRKVDGVGWENGGMWGVGVGVHVVGNGVRQRGWGEDGADGARI